MAEEPRHEGTKRMAVVTVMAYACTLALILAFLRINIYPRVDAEIVAQAASVVTAALTLPGALYITDGYKLPGHLVTGVFGAVSGLGATFLPTTSVVILGAWDSVVPLVFAAAMLSLVIMAERNTSSRGHTGPVVEVVLSIVMALLVMCPTCCFFSAALGGFAFGGAS